VLTSTSADTNTRIYYRFCSYNLQIDSFEKLLHSQCYLAKLDNFEKQFYGLQYANNRIGTCIGCLTNFKNCPDTDTDSRIGVAL